MTDAVNTIIALRGGIVATDGRDKVTLPLPVAGLMSNADVWETAAAYARIDAFAKTGLGSTLPAPFMTLSFMALLVIGEIKLSDKGLFDTAAFHFIDAYRSDV